MEAYEAAMAGTAAGKVTIAPGAKHGSFARTGGILLCPSTAYLTMKPSTRGVYNNIIARLCKSTNEQAARNRDFGRRQRCGASMCSR